MTAEAEAALFPSAGPGRAAARAGSMEEAAPGLDVLEAALAEDEDGVRNDNKKSML